MPDANPLLPVLHVLDPGTDWPDRLSEPDLDVLHVHAARLVRTARQLADAAQHDAGGQDAEAEWTAEVLMARWAATAGRQAAQVLRAAGTGPLPARHDAVEAALTAALLVHVALHATGGSGERHDKAALNRALAAAEWAAAARLPQPVTTAAATEVVLDKLPAGWLITQWPQEPDNRLTISRPDGRGGHEDVTLSGPRDEPVAVEFRRTVRNAPATPLTWPELCNYLGSIPPPRTTS